MPFSGLYINLDRSTDRRQSLIAHLASQGMVHAYKRFPALEPTAAEAADLRGLKTPGEVGIWKSLIALLQGLASDADAAPIVHVIEDDARFRDGAADMLDALRAGMLQPGPLESADLVFLDYYLTKDLFRFVATRPDPLKLREGKRSFTLLPASHYRACLGSFLVRRSSAAFIAEALHRMFLWQHPRLPVDLALRSLLHVGVVRGLLVSPPLGACDFDASALSTVQDSASADLQRSQLAFILLKLCASGVRSPLWCADRLAEMFDVRHSLSPDSQAIELLAVFEQVEALLVRF